MNVKIRNKIINIIYKDIFFSKYTFNRTPTTFLSHIINKKKKDRKETTAFCRKHVLMFWLRKKKVLYANMHVRTYIVRNNSEYLRKTLPFSFQSKAKDYSKCLLFKTTNVLRIANILNK